MDAGCRDNRWTAFLCTWPLRCSPLVLPPSQEVGSAWVSLSLVGCRCTGKVCSRETHSPSRASKAYGHNAFQITLLHTTVINSGRATQLTTAHTVGLCCGASLSADCGCNPGWCRSHPTVSEMTSNVSSGMLNFTISIPVPDLVYWIYRSCAASWLSLTMGFLLVFSFHMITYSQLFFEWKFFLF